VLLVGAVRGSLALEVVALHPAGESFALAHGGDVDLVPGRKDAGIDLLADRVAARVVEPQLDQAYARLYAGFAKWPASGLLSLLAARTP